MFGCCNTTMFISRKFLTRSYPSRIPTMFRFHVIQLQEIHGTYPPPRPSPPRWQTFQFQGFSVYSCRTTRLGAFPRISTRYSSLQRIHSRKMFETSRRPRNSPLRSNYHRKTQSWSTRSIPETTSPPPADETD